MRKFCFVILLLSITVMAISNNGFYAQEKDSNLKFSGDVRIRGEHDWNSQTKIGTMRSDRSRMRFRLRFGFTYKFNKNISFGGRFRSGNPNATQSPHINLGDELIPKSINIDKAYIKANWGNGFFWAGKNSYPFWKQNEFFWDDDATPEGFAVDNLFLLNKKSTFKLVGGFFLLDNNISNKLDEKSNFYGLQAILVRNFTKANLEIATGFYNFTQDTSQIDGRMQDLDYKLLQGGASISFPIYGGEKIKLGIDITYNMENYDELMYNSDQNLGYVGSIKYGDLNEAGSWLIGYYFAHIEKYAVVPGYAQDDWVRWGSNTVTRSSNFQGHEFRIAYAFAKKHNLVARFYFVDGIALEKGGSSLETGNRARLDWNIGF